MSLDLAESDDYGTKGYATNIKNFSFNRLTVNTPNHTDIKSMSEFGDDRKRKFSAKMENKRKMSIEMEKKETVHTMIDFKEFKFDVESVY